MTIKREVLWNFKISWQTLIQQKYFSGTKQMEVSFSFHNATKILLFLLLVLAFKNYYCVRNLTYLQKKGIKLDVTCFCHFTDVPKVQFYPQKSFVIFFFPICRNSKNKVNLWGFLIY